MVRVPPARWGVAVMLLASPALLAQSPEPPAALPADVMLPPSADLLRESAAEGHHPLLNMMVEGEFTALDNPTNDGGKETLRLKPEPKPQPNQLPPADCPVEMNTGIACPCLPMCLPYACPPPAPPCGCHKWHRRHQRSGCGGGSGYGNPYFASGFGYPGYGGGNGGCGRRCHHKSSCATCGANYGPWGYPAWGGCCDGCMGGQYFGGGYAGAAPYGGGCCRHCRHQRGGGYGSPSYGYGGFGGGYGGWANGSGMMGEGCCMGCGSCGFAPYCAPAPPPPPPSGCGHRFLRRHGGGNGYCGYANAWPGYAVPGAWGVDGGYNSFTDPNCFGCRKHCRCHGRCHHCRGGYAPPPCPYYPAFECPMTPGFEPSFGCSDCWGGSGVFEESPPPQKSGKGT